MGEAIETWVGRRLTETRSPEVVCQELLLAASVIIGVHFKPEAIDAVLAAANAAMARHARATAAECKPGAQRQ